MRIAACLAAGLLTALATAFLPPAFVAPARADDAAGPAPLKVTIGTLSPSTIPRKGTVTVTGVISNRSTGTWTDLQVYLVTSASPIRNADELETASETAPTADVGSRLTGHGLYDTVGDLAPGDSTDYVLSVSRKDLAITGEPGVYWLGVHVLGADENGRDSVADGRARTFSPLMPRRGPRTSMSLVMPLRADVRRRADGRLVNAARWARQLRSDGRLGRLLQMSQSAPDSLTWVVDPAILDAARSVAAENPPTSTATAGGEVQGGAAPSPSPSGSPSPFPSDDPSTSAPPADLVDGARKAADWLDLFRRQAGRHPVLTVPYGDLDAASVLRAGFTTTYQQAQALSTETMSGLDVASSSALAPATGYLPPTVLDRLDTATTVLLSDRAAPDADGPVLTMSDAPSVIVADSSAGSGGPAPGPRFSALAVRQRILSEAALHALSTAHAQPLVVSTPNSWNPGPGWRDAEFFAGLDVPWLDEAPLPNGSSSPYRPTSPDRGRAKTRTDKTQHSGGDLVYPASQRRAEVPFANLLATRELIDNANALADLLTRNDPVGEVLAKSAMLASSSFARDHANQSAVRTRAASSRIRRLMGKVQIEGPPFVTMSSEDGPFQVTLTNKLDQPVTVGIKADVTADGGGSQSLRITSPDPVQLAAGQRVTVLLRAHATDIGVRAVTLRTTTGDGVPLGSMTRLSVRSSQVSLVIWVIMGAGAAILFITIGFRLVRRIRASRTTRGTLLEREAS